MSPLRYDDEFPPVSSATEDGLLMVGGRLTPERVLEAYRRGIFPWPIVEGGYELLAWFSPDPRAIIELDQLHVSRRLARRVRSGRFRVTCDQAFDAVVAGCAAPRATDGGTWITPDMARVYGQLHTTGPYAQYRSLARERAGRRSLRHQSGRVLCRGIDVPSGARRVQSGPGGARRPPASAAGFGCSTSSRPRPMPCAWEPPRSGGRGSLRDSGSTRAAASRSASAWTCRNCRAAGRGS